MGAMSKQFPEKQFTTVSWLPPLFSQPGRDFAVYSIMNPPACLCLLGSAVLGGWAGMAGAAEQPNIVVIVTDDQGHADIGLNPARKPEVSTPHMDSLAAEGIFFHNGYISGNVCSPSRLGLMTGRYQQRFGVYTGGEGGRGIDPSVPLFPAFLKPSGYTCGAFGKWHLGVEPRHHPLERGFDKFYGFLGRGGHSYFNLGEGIYRDRNVIQDEGYLTDRLSDEASAFIRQNKDGPFFLYLAYNAVHSPPEAPKKDIDHIRDEFPGLSESRATLMAMLRRLDDGVGRVVKTLKDEGAWENTLLFFLTDNGGAPKMDADCSPLRGHKHENFEGGIRTPFIVTWPRKFPGGGRSDIPASSLDILPTSLDAAGIAPPAKSPPFDGKSLLPVIEGKVERLHDALFWSEGGAKGCWAVRDAEGWKAVTTVDRKSGTQKTELFQLANDPAEAKDLAAREPDKVRELTGLYEAWLEQMAEPMHGGSKRWNPERVATRKKDKKKKAAEEED